MDFNEKFAFLFSFFWIKNETIAYSFSFTLLIWIKGLRFGMRIRRYSREGIKLKYQIARVSNYKRGNGRRRY